MNDTISSHYYEKKMVKSGALQNICALKVYASCRNKIIFLLGKACVV